MKIEEFVSSLFELEVNMHIAHLQTTSFAEHKALDSVYKDIVELRDRFIESYQGEYGVINGYTQITIKEGVDPVNYLKGLLEDYQTVYNTLSECGYLQQIMDDIFELLYNAIYKLKTLK